MFFGLALAFTALAQEAEVSVQTDFDANLKTLETTTPVAASALPVSGVFYSAKHVNWPPFPANVLGLDAWPLDSNVFILDDLSSSAVRRSRVGGGMMDDDDSGPPTPEVGGGGSGSGSGGSSGSVGSITNDPQGLWLEITGMTNETSSLVIHPGTTNSNNGTYDLLYCTNLTSPISWQWVMRTAPGQTNVNVTNATDPQGFYRASLPNDLKANDSLGTDFWVGYPNLDSQGGTPNFSLYISSSVGATGIVAIAGQSITNTFSVTAGSMTNVDLSAMSMIDFDVIESYGIHIVASQPVSVYAMYFVRAESTAWTCYPTSLAGTNYCVMSHETTGAGNSEVAIVATADDTTVTFSPSASADTDSFTTNLQQGETFEVGTFGGDVTGSWVSSDKPIAVFAGDTLSFLPDNVDWANPLIQQQLPINDWGTEALALSFAGRTNGDTYRVLTVYSNTVVTINGVIIATNQPGEFLETNGLAGPVEFQGSKPIQVAHFANGTTWDGFDGDPNEILLPSVGFYLQTNIVFSLNSNNITGDFDQGFFTIIAPLSATNSTYVDATNKIINYEAIGSSGYFGAEFRVTNGISHKITSSQPIGVEVYGWGNVDAYGYFGGIVK